MAINIMDIEPSVISRDLRGKYVLLYGRPKSGKTTAACSFPDPLLVAFERGYNAIGGVRAADINKWSDFKLVIRQLDSPKAKEKYSTIVIDTVSIAWEYCEQFICQQNGVQNIADVPWGGGYSACKKEFESSLRTISKLGYGIVLICHNATRIEKDATGNEKEIISPELPKRAYEICNGLVDIIGYIGGEYDQNGEFIRYLYTRETPTLFAGSRFKYLAPKIKFGYTELVNAIADAINMAESKDGITVVEKANLTNVVEKLDFAQVRAEAQDLWMRLTANSPERATEILKKIEMTMGHKMKLSEFTEDQVDLLALIVDDMKNM